MTSRIPANISEITFDVIVIGAGINGAGIARDAAMRGLQVLLLDKGDIGGGTTSWSTRLIHGGLRYLEYAELGLVRESLRERETLFRIAPHLVKPLPILLPLYEQAARGPLTIRAGMIAYDLLSLDKSLPRHRMLTRDEALVEAPGLNRNGLRAAAIYYDAQVEFAERLVVENVLSAREHGATVITYARVEKSGGQFTAPSTEAGRVVEFVDVRTGAAFARSWPNYCECCRALGGRSSHQRWAPFGAPDRRHEGQSHNRGLFCRRSLDGAVCRSGIRQTTVLHHSLGRQVFDRHD